MKTKANKNTFVCITCMCCYYILIFAMREKETRLKVCIHSQCIDKKKTKTKHENNAIYMELEMEWSQIIAFQVTFRRLWFEMEFI